MRMIDGTAYSKTGDLEKGLGILRMGTGNYSFCHKKNNYSFPKNYSFRQ